MMGWPSHSSEWQLGVLSLFFCVFLLQGTFDSSDTSGTAAWWLFPRHGWRSATRMSILRLIWSSISPGWRHGANREIPKRGLCCSMPREDEDQGCWHVCHMGVTLLWILKLFDWYKLMKQSHTDGGFFLFSRSESCQSALNCVTQKPSVGGRDSKAHFHIQNLESSNRRSPSDRNKVRGKMKAVGGLKANCQVWL